jgi:hypothetical protein
MVLGIAICPRRWTATQAGINSWQVDKKLSFHWGPPRVYEIDMIQISLSDETLSYYFMNEVNLGVVNKRYSHMSTTMDCNTGWNKLMAGG